MVWEKVPLGESGDEWHPENFPQVPGHSEPPLADLTILLDLHQLMNSCPGHRREELESTSRNSVTLELSWASSFFPPAPVIRPTSLTTINGRQGASESQRADGLHIP